MVGEGVLSVQAGTIHSPVLTVVHSPAVMGTAVNLRKISHRIGHYATRPRRVDLGEVRKSAVSWTKRVRMI